MTIHDDIRQMNVSEAAASVLHEIAERIERLEASVGAPDATDAWQDQMDMMEGDLIESDRYIAELEGDRLKALDDLGQCQTDLALRTKQLDGATAELDRVRQELHATRGRLEDALKRRQAMERFWEKLTDALADSTSALAARFGNDLSWDELIAAAVEEIDNKAVAS